MTPKRAVARAFVLPAVLSVLLASGSAASAEQPPRASGGRAAAFDKLKGRWLRDSGGYIIEVRGVGPGGKVDAAYFNPRSIHVGKAQASEKGGSVALVVELRDVNYPGSTYTLTYDARNDRLVGRYFQAVTGETFDVYFVRLRS
jgi:uncharacterized protein (DUF2147 family)